MNTKQIVLSALLVDYLAVTAWAVHAAGWPGLVETVTSPGGLQMTAEIVLFIGVAAVAIYRDAKKTGHSTWWAASVCTGIVGVLAYLIRREGEVPAVEEALDRRALRTAVS